jgi:hypothetical protein
MDTHTIVYRNIVLEVTGKYYKGGLGSWGTEPDPQEFEIHMVELNGTNITELIDDINELERITLEKHYS